ncbi:ARL14 effector protein-like isoform X1 [Pollicipes pollicipes]|uniref:ARL14 effector protein-like isoform X1 n=1 Tax=Pollicipes pollicipes TaxID=41117 RepID=UPI0018851AB5|nr:ARL14 effector protein-like isoform X1 [Pollicipes pollicipes]
MSNSIGERERDLVLANSTAGFDPDRSNRERRKLKRKIYTDGRKRALYDDRGCLMSGQDVCDCLQPDCPGCHFPCAKCGSPMCGHECRSVQARLGSQVRWRWPMSIKVNRKWMYDQVEIEGTDKVLRNRFRE